MSLIVVCGRTELGSQSPLVMSAIFAPSFSQALASSRLVGSIAKQVGTLPCRRRFGGLFQSPTSQIRSWPSPQLTTRYFPSGLNRHNLGTISSGRVISFCPASSNRRKITLGGLVQATAMSGCVELTATPPNDKARPQIPVGLGPRSRALNRRARWTTCRSKSEESFSAAAKWAIAAFQSSASSKSDPLAAVKFASSSIRFNRARFRISNTTTSKLAATSEPTATAIVVRGCFFAIRQPRAAEKWAEPVRRRLARTARDPR